jgi:hypothetical protein
MSSEKHIGFYYENIFFKESKIGHGITRRNNVSREIEFHVVIP